MSEFQIVLTALGSVTVGLVSLLVRHDRKIERLETKVDIILSKVLNTPAAGGNGNL